MNRVEFLTKLLDACEATPYVAQAAQVDVIMVYDALTAEVTALRARVAELEAEARWVSVENGLPDRDKLFPRQYSINVLVANEYSGEMADSFYMFEVKDWSCCGFDVTHWRYITPPEAE